MIACSQLLKKSFLIFGDYLLSFSEPLNVASLPSSFRSLFFRRQERELVFFVSASSFMKYGGSLD